MPKNTSAHPQHYGGWAYMGPKVEALAKKWQGARKLNPAALNNSILMGPVFMAAREPEKLSARGRKDFWRVYSLEPDWILAVMQLMRSATVSPRSARQAILALLYADWQPGNKPYTVIAEARKEFPGTRISAELKPSSVENARSTIRKAGLKKTARI